MQFKVRALDETDQVVLFQCEAVNEAEARQQISQRGLFVLQIASNDNDAIRHGFFGRNHRFSVLLFSQELQALLRAGLSIVEAIEALREKESNSKIAAVLDGLLHGLQEGKRFSHCLAEQTEVFPALFVGIVQASERTSHIEVSLERYIQYQQRIDLIRNKLISAMIYPTILLIVGAAVSLFLIMYVVPRFSEVYRGSGRELPIMSQWLLEWGAFAASHSRAIFFVVLLALVGMLIGVRRLVMGEAGAFVLARLPGVGGAMRVFALSRLYLTLGMLLDGGIPVVPALTTSASSSSPLLRSALSAATEQVGQGAMCSEAFSAHGLTTPISYRLLRVGERSGELGKMLTESANFYEAEISRWIDRFIRSFEPLLMAFIGVIVGGIVILLYMPIFNLADGLM